MNTHTQKHIIWEWGLFPLFMLLFVQLPRASAMGEAESWLLKPLCSSAICGLRGSFNSHNSSAWMEFFPLH